MPLSSGSYFGPYRLLERLASHLDSDTWWVEHQGQTLRLRMLHRSRNGGNDAFLRAGEAMKDLAGAGVAKIIDLGIQDEVAYWVCEHIPGRNFRKVFDDPEVGVFRRFELLEATASVVAAAHNAGLVHGHLRPENLFELPDGSVKITDFGVETYRPDPPIPGPMAPDYGFFRYVAPERFTASSGIGSKDSDVWAMGMMLFEALAGRYPFPSDGLVPMVTAIREQPLPRSLLGDDVPVPVKKLIAWCLQRSPSARPQDAAVLVGAMARARRGEDPMGITSANAFEGTAVLPATGANAVQSPMATSGEPMNAVATGATQLAPAMPSAASSASMSAGGPVGPSSVVQTLGQGRRWPFVVMPLAAVLSAALVWGLASLLAPSEQPAEVRSESPVSEGSSPSPASEAEEASPEVPDGPSDSGASHGEAASNAVPPSTVPPNTVPPSTVPPSTVPSSTVPSSTVPPSAVPSNPVLPSQVASPMEPAAGIRAQGQAAMGASQRPGPASGMGLAMVVERPTSMARVSGMLPRGVRPAPPPPVMPSAGDSNRPFGAPDIRSAPGYGNRSQVQGGHGAFRADRVAAAFEARRSRLATCVGGMQGRVDFRAQFVGGIPQGRIQVRPSRHLRAARACLESHLRGFHAPGAAGPITYRMTFPR